MHANSAFWTKGKYHLIKCTPGATLAHYNYMFVQLCLHFLPAYFNMQFTAKMKSQEEPNGHVSQVGKNMKGESFIGVCKVS